MITQIKRHVVTKEDLGFVAAGTPLFVKAGKRIHYNVLPGQLVAYLETKTGVPLTIGPGDLTASNVSKLRIGVGYSKDGVTVEDIRHIGVEKAGNCDVEHMSVASPKCGNPAVKDFYAKCLSCDETYTIAVGVEDNFTRTFGKFQASEAEYIASYVPDCTTCDDCDVQVDAKEIAQGLVNNLQYDPQLTVGGKPYPDHIADDRILPFGVHAICENDYTFCLSFTDPDAECDTCTTLGSITQVSIDGAPTDIVGGSIPSDPTLASYVQLQSVVDQINEAFALSETADGHAYLTGVNANGCCPLQLHVNTTDPAFVLTGGAGAIAPTETSTNFQVGDAGEGYDFGIRVIAAPITPDCNCYLDRPLHFYGVKLDIDARGEGFVFTKTVDRQLMELPGGFGRSVQWQELTQDYGGSGRDYAGGGTGSTWIGAPRDNSLYGKNGAVTADCDTSYCSYYVRSRQHYYGVDHQDKVFLVDSFVHIPSNHLVTAAELKTLLETWGTLSISCDEVPTLDCTPLGTTCA